MVKQFYKKIMSLLIIVTLVFLFVGMLNYYHLYEGLTDESTMQNTDDTNEIRAVSRLKSGQASPNNSTLAMLSNAVQAYDPKTVADGINATADQINSIVQNVDSSKFVKLYHTFIDKINPPYPTSNNGIVSNATIANSYLNLLGNAMSNTNTNNNTNVVASGPSSTINASPVSSISPVAITKS